MKLHETVSSVDELSTKRNNFYQRNKSSHSLTADSCSQSSPLSYENLAPMTTSNYMNVYYHSTSFQQHYSGVYF